MHTIKINNPELERENRQSMGDEASFIAPALIDDLRSHRIKDDIAVSISQIEYGEAIDMRQAIAEVRAKYG